MGHLRVTVWLAAAAAVVACHRPSPAPPPVPRPPIAVPAAAPPEAGFTRIAELGIDVPLQPHDTTSMAHDGLYIETGACGLVVVTPDGWEDESRTGWVHIAGRVGEMAVTCSADRAACATSLCQRLRAVPGGATDMKLPVDPPIVVVDEVSGWSDLTVRGVQVWPTGVAVVRGGSCRSWRGAVIAIPPAQVDALMASLDPEFFGLSTQARTDFDDCGHADITVRHGGRERTVSICGLAVPGFRDVLQRVWDTVGDTPCWQHVPHPR